MTFVNYLRLLRSHPKVVINNTKFHVCTLSSFRIIMLKRRSKTKSLAASPIVLKLEKCSLLGIILLISPKRAINHVSTVSIF